MTLVTVVPSSPSTGLIVSGVQPAGPEIVHEAGVLFTFQEKVTLVGIPLRIRDGEAKNVLIEVGAKITQEPPL